MGCPLSQAWRPLASVQDNQTPAVIIPTQGLPTRKQAADIVRLPASSPSLGCPEIYSSNESS